ncbi:MAG TPA: GvpL/GvpF family gas vesicle protein [Candidatus Angelobacter sp.]|nr:GvpL/GvpF family gas vesicle protein [Candidatus Angelobacter sp.]
MNPAKKPLKKLATRGPAAVQDPPRQAAPKVNHEAKPEAKNELKNNAPETGAQLLSSHRVPSRLVSSKRVSSAIAPSEISSSQLASARQDPPPKGRYVYGVIESEAPVMLGKSNLGGVNEDVYTVHHGDIAAVVSHSSAFIFDPTRDNALAHEHVIESTMKNFTIIPVSFGTVFRTDDDIREVLKSIDSTLKDVLRQMSGKLEFGLKVTWDRDRIIEELKREHDEIHRFHQELTRKHLQSTYFARMQLGRMIDKALAELAAAYVRDIYDYLRNASVAYRDNKPIGDKMILNAAFLVEKEREANFDIAVNRIAQKFGERLNFKYTGPWPPYNFVNIRLKLEKKGAS